MRIDRNLCFRLRLRQAELRVILLELVLLGGDVRKHQLTLEVLNLLEEVGVGLRGGVPLRKQGNLALPSELSSTGLLLAFR